MNKYSCYNEVSGNLDNDPSLKESIIWIKKLAGDIDLLQTQLISQRKVINNQQELIKGTGNHINKLYELSGSSPCPKKPFRICDMCHASDIETFRFEFNLFKPSKGYITEIDWCRNCIESLKTQDREKIWNSPMEGVIE